MAATICCIQHRQKESKEKKWKSVLKINEHCHIWKNNGKLKKQDQCKTCKQEKKRLFTMDTQTKLFDIERLTNLHTLECLFWD